MSEKTNILMGVILAATACVAAGATWEREATPPPAPVVEYVTVEKAVDRIVYTNPLSTPCEQEDSDNCYWDASERGNGAGDDFITVNGRTFYGPVN